MNKKGRKMQKLRRMRSNLASAQGVNSDEGDVEGCVKITDEKDRSSDVVEEDFSDSSFHDVPKKKSTLIRDNLFSTRKMVEIDPQNKDYLKLYHRHLTDVEVDDLTEKYLSADIFNMMYVCKNNSHVMVFCLSVTFFQFVIIFLLILNSLKGDSNNFFNVPVNVETTVRVCQCCAILLMVVSQDDFVNTMAYFHDGYSPKILKIAPHASYVKYVACGLLKLLEGSLCLFMTFILVVQSDKVLGLFLNFAALSFVFAIDDVFFNLAGNFFFTDELSVLVNQIRVLKVPVPIRIPSVESAISSYRLINITYVYLLTLTLWAYVSISQLEGRYVCQSISVQFGDKSLYPAGGFSGAYDRVKFLGMEKNTINDRFVYIRRDFGDAMFAYCKSESAWTFSAIYPFEAGAKLDLDPCNDLTMFAKTKETETYDLIETLSDWSIINSVTLEPSKDFFSMKCIDCTDCNKNGKCIDDKCECFPGTYGLSCEFKGSVLCNEIYESEKKGLTAPGVKKNFKIAEIDLKEYSHHRPIFYRTFNDGNEVLDMIIFLGRRWLFTRRDLPQDLELSLNGTLAQSVKDVVNESENFLTYDSVYFSEAVSFGTSSDTGTPIGLHWYESQYLSSNYEPDEDSSLNVEFLCIRCNFIRNPCHNGGTCTSGETDLFGDCKCLPGYVGKLCEAVDSEIK